MSNSIKPEQLEEEIMKYLQDYEENIEDDVKETTDTITKQAVQELKKTSPRGKGTRKNPYYKSWTKQKGKVSNGKYTVKIHNKTNYQLTHLLEFGHATRNGGRTKAEPHIRPVEEKYNKLYEEKITTVIKRRSKK
jgi:hypothetical protein